jgi:hypothetical protein
MSLERDGFAIVDQCCSPSDCHEISARLDGITMPGSRLLLNNHWCQELAKTLRMRVAKSYPSIAQLVAVQCTYFNKCAETNWSVNTHQDRSFPIAAGSSPGVGVSIKEGVTFLQGPDRLLQDMLAMRLHIDDSMEDSGPLRVLPGSHLQGILNDDQIGKFRDTTTEQHVIATAGSVLLMRPLILHASSKATVPSPRRVLHFLFGPSEPPLGVEWHMAI